MNTGIFILTAFVFLCGWLILMISFIISVFQRISLSRFLKRNYHHVRNNLGFGIFDVIQVMNKLDFSIFFSLIFSFGSKEKIRLFINAFVDVKAIEEIKDDKLILKLRKYINMTSFSLRVWIMMVLLF